MEHFSNLYKGNFMHDNIAKRQKIYVEKINIEVSHNHINSNLRNFGELEHAIVFCGRGVTETLCDQINYISKVLKDKVFIGITDRGDLNGIKFEESIHIIPTYCKENEIPLGYMSENFLFCELKSIFKYIESKGISNYKYFSRMRKDIFLLVEEFINYLYCVPSLNNQYLFVTTEQSSNLMRRFCLSDQFFTIPFGLLNSIPYRIRPIKKRPFWWDYRHIQPHEIFKNNHQMEQWVWIHIINNSIKKLPANCKFDDYLSYLEKNVLVLPSKQIGYLWNRSCDFYFHNLIRFPSWGKGLKISSKPLRHFTSYSSFISPFLKKDEVVYFFKLIRFLIFFKRFLRFLVTIPIYYLRYLIFRR